MPCRHPPSQQAEKLRRAAAGDSASQDNPQGSHKDGEGEEAADAPTPRPPGDTPEAEAGGDVAEEGEGAGGSVGEEGLYGDGVREGSEGSVDGSGGSVGRRRDRSDARSLPAALADDEDAMRRSGSGGGSFGAGSRAESGFGAGAGGAGLSAAGPGPSRLSNPGAASRGVGSVGGMDSGHRGSAGGTSEVRRQAASALDGAGSGKEGELVSIGGGGGGRKGRGWC